MITAIYISMVEDYNGWATILTVIQDLSIAGLIANWKK